MSNGTLMYTSKKTPTLTLNRNPTNTHNQCKGDNTKGSHHRENYNDGRTLNAGEHMIIQQHQHQG